MCFSKRSGSAEIVDGYELFASALGELIKSEGIAYHVDIYPRLDMALENLDGRRDRVRLLIVEWLTDDICALALSDMRARFSGMRILVCAMPVDRSQVFECLTHGAHGVFFRTQSKADIASAISLVASGGVYIPPSVCDETPSASAAARPSAPPVKPEVAVWPAGHAAQPVAPGLSERQRAVLALMLKGLSNKAIARELALAEGTVKVHVNGVFRALKVNSRGQAIARVFALGGDFRGGLAVGGTVH